MSYTKIINIQTIIDYHKPGNDYTTPYKSGSYYEVAESQWWKGIPVKYDRANDEFKEWGYINLTKPNTFDYYNRTTPVNFDQTDWKKRKIITGITIKSDDGKSETVHTKFNYSMFFHLIVLKKSIEDFVGDTTKHYYDIIKSKNRFFPVLQKEYWSDNQISPFYFNIKPYNAGSYTHPDYQTTNIIPFWKDGSEYVVEEECSNWINEEKWCVDNINFNLKWDEDIYLLFKHDFHPKWASSYHDVVNNENYFHGEYSLPCGGVNTTIKYELI